MRRAGRAMLTAGAAVITAMTAVASAPSADSAGTVDPVVEARNYSITTQRAALTGTLGYQLKLLQVGTANALAATHAQLADPERLFISNLCASGENACAGDVRLYDWASKYGIVQPVLFTARNGATLSGHVWATAAGPGRRPGVVITPGSVQADEQLYWFQAQTLAKAGYVVLTFDAQGQGQSDLLGEGADALEGVPAQTDGRPFFDGTQDALNFFFSTPTDPYVPVPSCSTGTSHAAKQARRVAAGRDAAFNPYWSMLNRNQVGLAGHSFGASGVSYVGQADPRVKAIVAWDNLAGTDPTAGNGIEGCPADPSARAVVPITKPALGLSADYGLLPTPNTSLPDPLAKSTASLAYSAAGVDTGEIVIRGGTHFEFSFIPLAAFPASLRGADLAAWYTTAWFDKYLKTDPTADARLLTARWRHDSTVASVDPTSDGNAFSFYYRSRLDIGLSGGGRFACEDLRAGCAGLSDADGVTGPYSYLAVATASSPR